MFQVQLNHLHNNKKAKAKKKKESIQKATPNKQNQREKADAIKTVSEESD